jgi:hypothetical protein
VLWNITGLENPQGPLVVKVWPTQLGLVLGLDVKTISVQPVATQQDPKPGLIQPTSTEPTEDHALRGVFKPVGRKFLLIVTLRDGTVETIDPFAIQNGGNPRRMRQ